jgi:hypothetical protein
VTISTGAPAEPAADAVGGRKRGEQRRGAGGGNRPTAPQ